METSPGSPIQPSPPVDIPQTRGFFSLIRHWMGRIISTFIHIPVNLYNLIFRVQHLAAPIINHSSPVKDSPLSGQKKIKPEASPNNKVPSPFKRETSSIDNSDDIFEEDEENSFPIVEGLFRNIGLGFDLQEVLASALILDHKGEKQEDTDLASLTGRYQAEWNIYDNKSDETLLALLYRGHFEKGLFHGQGSFLTQELDGTLHVVLDGHFNHGTFVSGMMAMDECYIDGNFINGEKTGTGTIRYFKNVGDSNQPTHIEYRGDFLQALPHGKGKIWAVKWETRQDEEQRSTGVKLLADGEFEAGKMLKGHLQKNDIIFNGEWASAEESDEEFTGKMVNLNKEWIYKGKFINGFFEGKGELAEGKYYEYDTLKPLARSEEEMILVSKKDFVFCISRGEFQKGVFYQGEQEVIWKDGKRGIISFQKGEVVRTEITIPKNWKYVGNFASYALDGKGVIYDANGKEIYMGSIKCGFPHGKGRLKDNDKTQEGVFEWGKLIKSGLDESIEENDRDLEI